MAACLAMIDDDYDFVICEISHFCSIKKDEFYLVYLVRVIWAQDIIDLCCCLGVEWQFSRHYFSTTNMLEQSDF